MHSDSCELALELGAKSTRPDLFFAKTTSYTLMMTAMTFFQVLLLTRQTEASNTQTQLSSISMLTVGQQAILDAYLCLLHLTTGIMVEALFNTFAMVAFCEFVMFAVFEMRLLLTIWRARRDYNMDARSQQRELLSLYSRFYCALLATIYLSYQAHRIMEVVVFFIFSYWVPQIVLCAYNDSRQPFKAYYLMGISATRLALPLYLYGCPQNLLRHPTSAKICVCLVLYVTFQVVVLIAQSYLGPRFFIPKFMLPPKYDYFRPVSAVQLLDRAGASSGQSDVETGDAGHECVICMNLVEIDRHSARMVTPCNHFFHPTCLRRWMMVKMECPTCRTRLPPD